MVDLRLPPKVILCDIQSTQSWELFPYDDGSGDPYWMGGNDPKPFRWKINFSVNKRNHSSHYTREPKEYNGLDVYQGDWIASRNTGISLKIISITMKTENDVECIVEDIFRYNTFRALDGTGIGIFATPTGGVVFEANDEMGALIDPMPPEVARVFPIHIDTKFKKIDKRKNVELEQKNHGFKRFDSVAVNSNTNQFELYKDNDNNNFLIGSVNSNSLNPNKFYITPTNNILEFRNLPGKIGEKLYVDSNGDFTTDRLQNKAFVKLREGKPSKVVGTVDNPSVSFSDKIEINRIGVEFTSGPDLDPIINDINNLTSQHNVIASRGREENEMSPTETLVYGQVGAFTDSPGPAEAEINGVNVVFATDFKGQADFGQNIAVAEDMAFDINKAEIPNIKALSKNNNLVIVNEKGLSIDIVNINPDANGNNFAGVNSCTGLPLSISSNNDNRLQLETQDAREILLKNVSGDPMGDIGIYSVNNSKSYLGLMLSDTVKDTIIKTKEIIPTQNNQEEFDVPEKTKEILKVSINGLETKSFVFNETNNKVTLSKNNIGYYLDPNDVILLTFKEIS